MIDFSKLNKAERGAEIALPLQELHDKLEPAFPLCEFYVHSVIYQYIDNVKKFYVKQIDVIQKGEVLGSIGVTDRYVSGRTQQCCYVMSERINKSRGISNATLSKDIKVLVRHAKKAFICKSDEELLNKLKESIGGLLSSLMHTSRHAVQWSMDTNSAGFDVFLKQYKAFIKGETKVVVEVNPKVFDEKKCKQYKKFLEAENICSQFRSDSGYVVLTKLDGSFIVYDVKEKYVCTIKDISLMPIHMQNKISVLNILEKEDIVETMGVWFTQENDQRLYYLVDGEVKTES